MFQKQNRADIKREVFTDHPTQAQAEMNIKLAGNNLAPWGFEYEASAVIHYYKKPNTHDYIFIAQTIGFHHIPEGQADVGLKELRRSLMAAYGREEQRRKDTKDENL